MYYEGIKLKGLALLVEIPELRDQVVCGRVKVIWHECPVCPLWLHSFCPEVCYVFSPSQSCCHALSSGTEHNAFCRGYFSHLRLLPIARPENPVPLVVKSWHSGDSRLTLFMGKTAKGGHLGANLGFGVFWFIPPGWAYLHSTSRIGRISPVCIHEVCMALIQFRVDSLQADD